VRDFIASLCSDACAGRKPGSKGGLLARSLVREELKKLGLAIREQPLPRIGGANLVAELPGSGPLADREIVVGAHYDHLGTLDGAIYRGADDNAAAVAILLEAAKVVIARGGPGRRVLFVAFDAEESPYFRSGDMGSERFCEEAGFAKTDAMIAMDLVGHAIGPAALPAEVRQSLFVLGAEKGELGSFVRSGHGIFARRVDADLIPPLSDYDAYWKRGVPFLFLTSGRSAVYHTPEDTPEKLDYTKIAATAAWLGALVSDLREHAPVARYTERRDDATTVETLLEMTKLLSPFSPMAVAAAEMLGPFRGRKLTKGEQGTLSMIVSGLEQALA
jgi:Zn-dependent M28 family amino/carboxypeptidase